MTRLCTIIGMRFNDATGTECARAQRGIMMKASIIAVVPLALSAPASLAQQLSVEERMCITNAVAKMPPVAVSSIEGSRVTERRVVEQPQSQGRRNPNQFPVYRIKVEIDASVAGQRSTYLFNCIQSGQATLVQPLGMR